MLLSKLRIEKEKIKGTGQRIQLKKIAAKPAGSAAII